MTPKKLMKTAVLVAVAGVVLGLISMAVTDSPSEFDAVTEAQPFVEGIDTDGPIAQPVFQGGGGQSQPQPQPQGPGEQDEQDEPVQPQPSDEPEAPADVDADDDGVEDASDNCPQTPNADQSNFDGDAKGDACDADDDNDNLSDAAEGGYNTNPYKKDTDGDGWWDGNEVNTGFDPTDPSSHPEYIFPGEYPGEYAKS